MELASSLASWWMDSDLTPYSRCTFFPRLEKAEDGKLRWRVNHMRVYRLYREEGLAMQRRRRKKFRAEARVPLALPTRANEMWTMDYTHDQMAGGRKFRTLNLNRRLRYQSKGEL